MPLAPKMSMKPPGQLGLGVLFCLISPATIGFASIIPLGEVLGLMTALMIVWAWYYVHRKWRWPWFSVGVLFGLAVLSMCAVLCAAFFIRFGQ